MSWKRMMSGTALLAAVVLGGCSTSKPTQTDEVGDSNDIRERRSGSDWPMERQKEDAAAEAPAPAPAPRPAPAQPAAAQPAPARPAPAPVDVPVAGRIAGKLYIPTGEPATSVLLVEKAQPGEVMVGKPFDYEIRVTNISKNKLEGVEVTDTLSSNLKLTENPAFTMREGAARIAVGALNAGESKSYKMTAAATGGDSIRNCVTATYNTTLCLTTPVVAPALKITKALPAEVLVCDLIPVKVVVTNSGTGAARGVKLADTLPAGMTVDGKTSLTMDVGTLGAGQSREVQFNAKVAKSGKYDNKVTATAEGGMTAESAVASVVAKQPVLAIDVKCPPAKVRAGTSVTYQVTVSNKGDGVAADTMLRMPVAQGLSFASATEGGAVAGQEVAWRVGSLAPGQSRTFAMTGKAAAGVINTTFNASAKCADAVAGKCTIEAAGVPDIGTSIDDDNGVVLLGTNHDFIYVVQNQGQVDLTNVTVEFTPDAGLEYVSTDAAAGAVTSAGAKQTLKVGTVKAGETRKVKMTYKGTKEGDLIIQSVTTSDQTRAVRNDEQVSYVK